MKSFCFVKVVQLFCIFLAISISSLLELFAFSSSAVCNVD